MSKCERCGGFVVRDSHYCTKGYCEFLRCVYCGHCWFDTPTKGEIEEEVESEMRAPVWAMSASGEVVLGATLAVPSPGRKRRRSYAEIAKEFGLTKQRIHMICKAAMQKVLQNAESLEWRVR